MQKDSRVCSGVVPLIYKNGEPHKVVIVKSSDGTSWVFPKGGVEKHLSPRGNAAKEAFEEAGIVGNVGKKVGTTLFIKNGLNQSCQYFVMEVAYMIETYDEQNTRARQVVSVNKAVSLISPDLIAVLDKAVSSKAPELLISTKG